MSKEHKELRLVSAGFIIVAVMLFGFSIRTYFRIYRLKPGQVVTREMYETLFAATSTITFLLVPMIAAFLLLFAFLVWRLQRRLP
jgi:heme/copper-type cytochrome/quinol oxidase subunit 3